MTPPDIVDVTETDFQYEVLAYSQQVPVVVDFWATWCAPCRILGPLLEKLAEEAKGAFRLAKLDVDKNPSIAMRYNIRGIPAVKAFLNGEVVVEFTGVQSEPQVREFLRKTIPSPADLQFYKAESLLRMQEWGKAGEVFLQVLNERPEHAGAALGYVKSLLVQGYGLEALKVIDNFPTGQEYTVAKQLRPLAIALIGVATDEEKEGEPVEATYAHALRLVSLGNLPAAMDGILEVLRRDKHYRDDEARKVIIGVFEILGNDNPTTRKYRAELASILF